MSDLARLEVELYEERNPANPESQVAEVTLYLKGVTLRAKEATRDMDHSINLVLRGARAAGQAPPREAPQAPRGARRRRRPRAASSPRSERPRAGRGRPPPAGRRPPLP